MKIAPFARAMNAHNASGPERLIEHVLLHTGQHYDASMSASFFDALGIPNPNPPPGLDWYRIGIRAVLVGAE